MQTYEKEYTDAPLVGHVIDLKIQNNSLDQGMSKLIVLALLRNRANLSLYRRVSGFETFILVRVADYLPSERSLPKFNERYQNSLDVP